MNFSDLLEKCTDRTDTDGAVMFNVDSSSTVWSNISDSNAKFGKPADTNNAGLKSSDCLQQNI
jgi:hypothetical protein